jgi:PPOX class probable F420-dependent enzyme
MALTDEQRRFLEEKHFSVLGTMNRSGSPHLTIMWYLLDGDEVVFNTKAGRAKALNLDLDPRVSLLVYGHTGYRYVRIDGKVRAITDRATTQADIARLAARYHDPAEAARAVARFEKEERISYRLRTARVYDYR